MTRTSVRRLLAAAEADVDRQLAGGFVGCPVVVVVGPKGGGTKTTTSASLLHQLGMGDRVAGMLLGIDANPDVGDLLEKLGQYASRAPARFTDFALEPGVVQRPADWGHFVDLVGRVHVMHNQGVPNARIEQLSAAQYTDALRWARQFAALMVVDGGTALLHPSSVAAATVATSMVIATRADPLAINKSVESVAEMVTNGLGGLVSRATVVLTETDKNASEATYGKGRDYFAERVARVVVVPYDRAAGAVGGIKWGEVKPATRLAWTEVLASTLSDIRYQQQQRPEQFAQGPSVRGPILDVNAAWPGRVDVSQVFGSGPAHTAPQDLPVQAAPMPPAPETGDSAGITPGPAPVPSWVRRR